MPNRKPKPKVKKIVLDIPEVWHGPLDILQYSKRAVMKYIWEYVSINIATLAIVIVLSVSIKNKFTSMVVQEIVSIFSSQVLILILIAGIKSERKSLSSFFDTSFKRFSHIIELYALMAFIGVISFVLLIVPFFFIFPRISMATYYVMDQNLGPIKALKASWAVTRGSLEKIYGIFFVNIGIALLFVTIIGIPFAIYYLVIYSASFPILYFYLDRDFREL